MASKNKHGFKNENDEYSQIYASGSNWWLYIGMSLGALVGLIAYVEHWIS